MDKLKLVLDIIDNPHNYTGEQLTEILSDQETKEIYNLLCKTVSATQSDKETDIDAEWSNFAKKHSRHSIRHFAWPKKRVASIAAIIGASILTVSAVIAITMSAIYNNPTPVIDNAAISPSAQSVATDTSATEAATYDSVRVSMMPVVFEDETLEQIMKVVSDTYSVEIKFNNKNAATLRLYYKLDTSLTLSEVLEQLNTFEQIRINRNEDILSID